MLPGECRLQRIKDIAGPSGQDDAALDALMNGDFDPDQYDKQMAAAFGDDYYEVFFGLRGAISTLLRCLILLAKYICASKKCVAYKFPVYDCKVASSKCVSACN